MEDYLSYAVAKFYLEWDIAVVYQDDFNITSVIWIYNTTCYVYRLMESKTTPCETKPNIFGDGCKAILVDIFCMNQVK